MHDIKTLFVKTTATIADTMQVIDQNAIKMAIVSDDNITLDGVITDGDIRRALLNKKTINDPITSIFNRHPITVEHNTSIDKINAIMMQKSILAIIETDNNKIIKVHIDKNLNKANHKVAVIMAGGLGQRLMPLTKDLPKPMIKINGKPILETIITKLTEEGFTHIYISVNYKKEIIMDYFQDGAKFNVNIKYLIEDKRLGTGGALSLIKDELKDSFLVTNADIITDISYASFLDEHQASSVTASILTNIHRIEIPYGIIETNSDGYFNKIVEKPTYDFLINTGIYALAPSVISHIPKDTFFNMTDLIETLHQLNQNIKLHPTTGHWCDIGKKTDLEQYNYSI